MKKNILIVDDDKVEHYLSEKALSSLKWINKISHAFNGKEALFMLDAGCRGVISIPDLILLDLHMPVLDGFSFMEGLQTMDCLKDHSIPIVVVSSSICPKERQRAEALGISGFLQKPIVEKHLLALIS